MNWKWENNRKGVGHTSPVGAASHGTSDHWYRACRTGWTLSRSRSSELYHGADRSLNMTPAGRCDRGSALESNTGLSSCGFTAAVLSEHAHHHPLNQEWSEVKSVFSSITSQLSIILSFGKLPSWTGYQCSMVNDITMVTIILQSDV